MRADINNMFSAYISQTEAMLADNDSVDILWSMVLSSDMCTA